MTVNQPRITDCVNRTWFGYMFCKFVSNIIHQNRCKIALKISFVPSKRCKTCKQIVIALNYTKPNRKRLTPLFQFGNTNKNYIWKTETEKKRHTKFLNPNTQKFVNEYENEVFEIFS